MYVTIDITSEDIEAEQARTTSDTYLRITHPSGLYVLLEDRENGIEDPKYSVYEVGLEFDESQGYQNYKRDEMLADGFVNIHLPEIYMYREKED